MYTPNIETIQPEDLSLVYSGKQGCGCGCNGTYRSDLRSRRRVLKAIQTGEGVYSVQPDGDGHWIFARERREDNGGGRYYWAYTDPNRARNASAD